MKKIISLILGIVVAFACVAPVSFATATPTMNVTAAKITDFSGSYAGYAEYANDYGLDVYEVTFTATGIAMTTTTSGMAKNLNGDSIVGASIKFDAVSTAERDVEWMAEQFYTITPPTAAAWSGNTWAAAMAGTAPLYPAAKTAATVTADMESPALYKMIFVVDPTQPVTITFKECAVNVGTFATNNMQTSTSYKMIDNTLAMSQASLTLPVPDSKVDVTSVTISGATNATVGDSVALSATVEPNNATNPAVTWTKVSGDGAVSASGVVTANSAGNIVVKATADGVDSANYTVSFAAAETFIDPVDDKVDGQDKGTTALTDLQGNPVNEFKKNYGIAKFDAAITTGTKNYFIVATDDKTEPETHEFAVDFAEIGVEAENATVSFFAIVKSATHKITNVALKVVDK